MENTRLAGADLRIFSSALGTHLFVADGSRVFDVDPELRASSIGSRATATPIKCGRCWDSNGSPRGRWIDDRASPVPPLSSISLNVAQACNMSCGYCYADLGKFGGKARMMTALVARETVDRLIASSEPVADLLVGFMGGEPLLNRELIHEIVPYATEAGSAAGHRVRFSITTNATLLTAADALLFSTYPFCVQISIDGAQQVNDLQRPMRDGAGSYDRVIAGIKTLLANGRPRQTSGRVTVTRNSGDLLAILDHLIACGFDDVGFAVVLVSPSPQYELREGDFDGLLEQMVKCGRKALKEIKASRNYPFSNFLTAMDEIHRGSHRPYPCGAGAAYLSANAEGKLYACHRLIDDDAFAMGDVKHGPDHAARQRHLETSHVDLMQPCSTCWARYLCGGGCYHEVARRGASVVTTSGVGWSFAWVRMSSFPRLCRTGLSLCRNSRWIVAASPHWPINRAPDGDHHGGRKRSSC